MTGKDRRKRFLRWICSMPLGMGGGLFSAMDVRTLAPLVPQKSVEEALRGDWEKMGKVFQVVMDILKEIIGESPRKK